MTKQPEVMAAAAKAGKTLGRRLREGHDRMQVIRNMQRVMMARMQETV